MIRFPCAQCGAAVEADDELAGKQGQCPTCGAVVAVPSTTQPTGAAGGAPPPLQGAWPPGALAPTAPARPPGKTLAVLALVFGLCGFIPALGLTAVILAIVVLATKRPGRGMAFAGLILGVLLAAGSTTAGLWYITSRARRRADLLRCRSNLHLITLACQQYAAEQDGKYPPNLEALERYVGSADCFQCPATGRKYIYAPGPGAGRRLWDYESDAIVACDEKGNHEDGRNVAFADGHVQFVSEQHFQELLSRRANRHLAERLGRDSPP